MAFPPQGPGFASACADPVLRLWKLEDLTPEVWAVIAKDKSPSLGISSLAFSHDGKLLIAGSLIGNSTLRIWDASGGDLVEKSPPAALAKLVTCSPTQPILAFAGDDGVIHLWDLKKSPIEKLRTIDAHEGKKSPIVKALCVQPRRPDARQRRPGPACPPLGRCHGKEAREWQLLDEGRALAFSSDGRHLAIGNSDGTLYILRLASRVP